MPLTAVRAYAAGRKDTGARGMGPSAPAWDGRTGRPKLPPAAKAEPGTPREPELPAGVAAFARLSGLVPPGTWPVTLPTTADQPVQVGIRERLEALLPPEHHAQLVDRRDPRRVAELERAEVAEPRAARGEAGEDEEEVAAPGDRPGRLPWPVPSRMTPVTTGMTTVRTKVARSEGMFPTPALAKMAVSAAKAAESSARSCQERSADFMGLRAPGRP